MKKLSFLFTCILFSSFVSLLHAQESNVTWISGDGINQPIHLRFQLGDYALQSVSTPNGPQSIVVAEGCTPILRKGAPDLPLFSASVIIPDLATLQAEVLSSHQTELTNINIAPSKGNIKRTIDPNSISRIAGEVYSSNSLFPEAQVALRNPHILSDFRGQTVLFYPFQYNAQTHTLHVTDQIDVILRPVSGHTPINPLYRNADIRVNSVRQELYTNHFVNFGTDRYTAITEQTNMLIITDPAFQTELEPLVQWKRESGMNVEVITLAEAGGNVAGITNAVHSRYTSNGLTYLLLVGDISQIPSPQSFGGKSDPTYGFILGNDTYPEVIVGRISAENSTHVATQVSKIVQYEKALLPTSNLDQVLVMASDQGPGDDNELDWEHERVMRDKLTSYTYAEAFEQYDGSQGELDPDGNPSPSDVSTILNQGVGLINYTGHGSAVSFGTSGFSNSEINQLQNNGLLPFIWSVGCVNGEFDNGTCFGEAWLRATRNGQLTGVVATFMSSINQSWDPPMAAQDEMVDLLTGNVLTTTTRTFGGLSLNGCLKMNDEYGDAGDEMTATWHVFGDPSLMVRTSIPLAMNVTHAATTALGSNGFMVSVDVENARVAITQNGILLGSSLVSGGQAWVEFEPLTLMDPLLVTVTAFNRIPYQGPVQIENPSDAFILVSNHSFSEASGNGNQLADFGETIYLNTTIQNVGGISANDVMGTLTSNDSYIIILQNQCPIGLVDAGNSIQSSDCFQFQVSSSIQDQTLAHFIITYSDDAGQEWSQPITVMINAPELHITSVVITEVSGNGNGLPDAGESIQIEFINNNAGHAATLDGNGTLTGSTNQFTVDQPSQSILSVDAANQLASNYTLTISSSVLAGSYIPATYTWMAGDYSITKDVIIHVGAKIEDAETNDFTHFAWQNADESPWTIDQDIKYEGATSFKSGTISNNMTSSLIINWNVSVADTLRFMKKVSSEEGYDFLKFYVDGNEIQSWSGVVDWSQEQFPITSGLHEFMWVYAKDEMISSNEDAAWIDYVVFPAGDDVPEGFQASLNLSENSFQLWPNPSTDGQFILSGNQLISGKYSIRILDIGGRCIQTHSETLFNSNSQWSMNLQAAAGLYFIEIRNPIGELSILKFTRN
ncbi:MAG TPA: C25 family cysteine peptidase [Flavobacteriales bacterium]|nr:C25 family cysteine peptidase [Flavobacteriales bacterium]